ncbi:MAG: iron-sulfur cluster assembly accessory protein [Aphanocapsa feldmannii 277cV]|uniref:Iron-sulfur cluster assembly accessory protein n=2 Tax=Aphanocapsa feldmannii TaxID=192050 RepID=A0A524RQ40_9CHRO|nr:MAG: iron-sulfur cluster assembly accessory protein [Aphanocapsa feldmannii 288cV]TGG94525.1 MAG: iron-sulfur cluster assembly accessory protein [Aphanocapsa feldmannii 277cV]TGH19150.1 MAG: iron-sulfur cluster assembly accessory protein [Aphanocapsa feldmannii 277cI]
MADSVAAPSSSTARASVDGAPAARAGKDGKGILITAPALQQLEQLCSQRHEDAVLRVGVRSGGCSGMSYTMDFIAADAVNDQDEIYDYELSSGECFRVVSDPKSMLYLYGLQLDFSAALIGGGFNFTNPNASQTCGCGSSFAV